MTIEIKILSLVTNAETVPLHFTLELEGLRDQGKLNDEMPTWSLTWQTMDIVSWSTGLCVKAHLKEVVLTQKQEIMILENFTTA